MTATTTTTSTAERAAASDRRAQVVRWAGDTVAVVLLVTLLWWLERHDGGYPLPHTLRFATVALLAVPVAWAEARRLPRAARWTLAAWGVGIVLSVLAARIRAHALHPTLILAVTPLVGLATRRLWRRSWGPPALLGLIAVAFGLYLSRSFLQWWGQTLLGQQPRWLPLSWHNQGGILMAAFGTWALALALTARRVVWVAAVLIAGLGLGTAWLSSSRGAPLTAAAVVALLIVGRLRERDRSRTLVTAALVAVLTVGSAAGLLWLDQRPDAVTPLASRGPTLSGNSAARIEHVQAALRMFLDRPLTGHGVGSYRVAAQDFTDPDANLTSSAHNEYAEVLGEGGLVLGVPFLISHAAVGLAALSLLVGWRGRGRLAGMLPAPAGTTGAGPAPLGPRREDTIGVRDEAAPNSDVPSGDVSHGDVRTGEVPNSDVPDGDLSDDAGATRLGRRSVHDPLGPLRGPVQLAGAAMLTTIGLHVAIDFDWHYPVLPGLLAMGAAVLWPVSTDPETGGTGGSEPTTAAGTRWWTGAAVAPLAVALVLAVGAGWWARSLSFPEQLDADTYATAFAPWDLDAAISHGYTLLQRGEVDAARTAVQRGLPWNPGSSRLVTVARLVDLASGEVTPDEVVAALADDRHRFDEYQVSAEALIAAGAYEQAATLLAQAEQLLRTYERWGVGETAQRVRLTELQLLAARDGCDVAAARAAELATDGPFPDGITADELLRAADTACP